MMHGTTPRPTAALSIDGVSYAYGARQALSDVSFAVAPGRFAVLLGLNGAGKSTLFALVTRLYATRQGRIAVFGHDVGRTPGAALRMLGVVFQARTLDLDLSIAQNLAYHAALHGLGHAVAHRRADELLARIGLTDRAADKVRALSGGQMRRVEIARALLHRPRLLVLDEPTVGLDVAARADILTHVRELVQQEGVAAIWATHLMDEVAADDEVIVLHHGRVLSRGTSTEIAGQTGTPDIRSAFAELTRDAAALPGEAA